MPRPLYAADAQKKRTAILIQYERASELVILPALLALRNEGTKEGSAAKDLNPKFLAISKAIATHTIARVSLVACSQIRRRILRKLRVLCVRAFHFNLIEQNRGRNDRHRNLAFAIAHERVVASGN